MGSYMEEKTKPTKIAVVRCDVVSETCPGVGCFKAFNERKSHFETYDEDTQRSPFSRVEAVRAGECTVW